MVTSPKDSHVPIIIEGNIVSQKAKLVFLELVILSKMKNIEMNPVQKYKERNITLIKYDIFMKYFEFIILVKELKKINAKG
jgi:hypothetical protein